MAILQSCCFWKDVRKGSYATAIYTLIYFAFCSAVMLIYVNDEHEFLKGQREHPVGESILARGNVTPATVCFNVFSLVCSSSLVVASVLVLAALKYNRSALLIPWMALMLCDILIELCHVIYLITRQTVVFDPVVGFLFTMDFFIMSLNLYCLLCVVSLYQEYQLEQQQQLQPQDHQGYGRSLTSKHDSLASCESQTLSASSKACGTTTRTQLPTGSPFISSFQPSRITTIPEETERSQNGKEFGVEEQQPKVTHP